MPLPPSVPPEDMEIKIGSPAYVFDGFDITLVCDILSGTRPITIRWFRNGAPDSTRGNVSTITVTDYNDGDVFTCRADNDVGFDMKSTTINVLGKRIENDYNIAFLNSCRYVYINFQFNLLKMGHFLSFHSRVAIQ